MKLFPLRKEQFDCLRPIFEARIKESGMSERTTVEYGLRSLINGYDRHVMSAFVDAVENPKCCLIITRFASIVSEASIAYVHLLYVAPEHRGDPAFSKALFETAESYARLNGASVLSGSSWLYRGSRGTDALWVKNGFEIQETSYIKQLT